MLFFAKREDSCKTYLPVLWIQILYIEFLDPDPGFWPDLDPDLGLYNQFKKIKKFNIIFEKK